MPNAIFDKWATVKVRPDYHRVMKAHASLLDLTLFDFVDLILQDALRAKGLIPPGGESTSATTKPRPNSRARLAPQKPAKR